MSIQRPTWWSRSTSPIHSLDKLPIYARIGVPEVWRYDGARLEILTLENDGYTARPSSRVLPAVTAEALTTLPPHSMGVGDIAWMRSVRAWARTLPTPGAPSVGAGAQPSSRGTSVY
jgi:hypothetical protein